jgi:hypothetical protein
MQLIVLTLALLAPVAILTVVEQQHAMVQPS